MFIAKQPQYAKLKEKDELNAIAIRKKHNSITECKNYVEAENGNRRNPNGTTIRADKGMA